MFLIPTIFSSLLLFVPGGGSPLPIIVLLVDIKSGLLALMEDLSFLKRLNSAHKLTDIESVR